MNTKYKWLARFGFCKTICPKCGHKLSARGYYTLLCTSCLYNRQDAFGHFWSRDISSRNDPAIDKFSQDWKKDVL